MLHKKPIIWRGKGSENEEGLDFVEAYVNKDSSEDPYDFRGPLAMYQKCGFIISGEREGKVVVRKALK